MSVGRRRFLRLAWATALLTRLRMAPAAPASQGGPAALGPFLDTLIPPDSTPGATALEVDRRLLEAAARDRVLAALLKRGCRWLDVEGLRRGADDFAALDPGQRETVVQMAAAAPRWSVRRRFFERLRREAFHHYYARPESWQGMGLHAPPQPGGYPAYSKAPSAP